MGKQIKVSIAERRVPAGGGGDRGGRGGGFGGGFGGRGGGDRGRGGFGGRGQSVSHMTHRILLSHSFKFLMTRLCWALVVHRRIMM